MSGVFQVFRPSQGEVGMQDSRMHIGRVGAVMTPIEEWARQESKDVMLKWKMLPLRAKFMQWLRWRLRVRFPNEQVLRCKINALEAECRMYRIRLGWEMPGQYHSGGHWVWHSSDGSQKPFPGVRWDHVMPPNIGRIRDYRD